MFSLIIPCYNEEANLPALLLKVSDLLTNHPKNEVILVNNGSSDKSIDILNNFRLEHNNLNIKICNIKENKGYGNGILEGLKIATLDVLAWSHADLQTDLLDSLKAFKLYSENPDVKNLLVKGYRKERKLTEEVFSFGMALYASLRLRKWLIEINAQPKMFSRDFYNLAKENAPLDFSLDLHWMNFAKNKGAILNFPVKFLPRIAGEAKGGSGSDFKTKLKIIKRSLSYINKVASRS